MTRYKLLMEEVRKRRPISILEVGTWSGIHAVQMIREAQKFFPTIRYFGFDLFEDFVAHEKEYCPKKAAKYIDADKRLKESGAVYTLVKGNTHETLKHFIPPNYLYMDFIFIDGGHSLETIASDWGNLQKLIGPETVVIFDDYYLNNYKIGCAKLITELQTKPKWVVHRLEPPDITHLGDRNFLIKVFRSS